MLSRNEALELIKNYTKKENNVKHMLAVAAIMAAIAQKLGHDSQKYELTGLLHDIDYEMTTPEQHGLAAEKILSGKVEDEIIHAIKSHNFEMSHIIPSTTMEKALVAADAVSGLVIAAALVMPSKKLDDVKLETLIGKFKSKDFARAVNRNKIKICEQIGIPLEEFLQLALDALKSVHEQLGL